MQRRLTLHGIDKGYIVDVICQTRKQIADPSSASSVLSKRPEAFCVVSTNPGKRLLTQFDIERLASLSFQFGFITPGVDVAQPARTKDFDDAIGGCRKLGGTVREWILGGIPIRRQHRITVQQCGQRDTTKTTS